MQFLTRKLIKPSELNSNNTLFGGALLRWIDEEAAIHAMQTLKSHTVVTKYMSEINFISSARQGDIVEIGIEIKSLGRTSISFRCAVRNTWTQKDIITIEKIVFVNVNDDERPHPHGLTLADVTLA